MQVTGPRRRALLTGASLLLLGAPLVAFAPPATGADTCATYSAVAAADGARVGVESPGFLVVERTDVGTPVAQAFVDSYGTSTAYAAHPDPSEEALSALPLAGVPRNTYPLVVESQYPSSPETKLSAGAFNLAATSEARLANAVAESGVDASSTFGSTGLTRATATAGCADTGEVTSVAESTTEGASFGEGTLRIGRIHSMAKVVVATDGTPTVESDLEVSQVTIAGQTVGFGDEGLVLGTTPGPLPDNPLAEILADAGIDVTYVAAAPQTDGRGVTAPALRVAVTKDVTGAAPTVTTFTYGRAFAVADAAPGAAPPTTVTSAYDTGGGSVTGGSPSNGATLPSGSAATTPTANPSGATVSGGTGLPSATPSTPGAVANAAPVSSTGPFSAWSIYAVLVVGAALVLSSGLLFKTVGVRLGWT